MMNSIYYTGIGSRSISISTQKIIRDIGEDLAIRGMILRSGHATGSDISFEIGCDRVGGRKEIFLPFRNFNRSDSNLIVSDEGIEMAKKFHPAWDRLSAVSKRLHGRNSHQVLGKDLNLPSKFIICYTADGSRSGGTGQALRIGEYYNIPILDIGLYDNEDEISYRYNSFINNILGG